MIVLLTQALLLFGNDPRLFMPGAFIQYARWGGDDNASVIMNQRIFQGNLCTLLPQLDSFIDMAIVQKRPIPVSALREEIVCNYPKWALREILMNAIMHRDYKSNAPIKFYQYPGRIEIINHGGLYGMARPENFPTVNDYRNPAVAEEMQILGYVNMLNHGIPEVQRELEENVNGKAIFTIDRITVFEAKLIESRKWHEVLVFNFNLENDSNELPDYLKSIIIEMSNNLQITYEQLAKKLNVSRETIRRRIQLLRSEYKIISRDGKTKGTWRILNRY